MLERGILAAFMVILTLTHWSFSFFPQFAWLSDPTGEAALVGAIINTGLTLTYQLYDPLVAKFDNSKKKKKKDDEDTSTEFLFPTLQVFISVMEQILHKYMVWDVSMTYSVVTGILMVFEEMTLRNQVQVDWYETTTLFFVVIYFFNFIYGSILGRSLL